MSEEVNGRSGERKSEWAGSRVSRFYEGFKSSRWYGLFLLSELAIIAALQSPFEAIQRPQSL
jgi:hypothetical protein